MLDLSNIYNSNVKYRSAAELTMYLRSNRDTKTLLNITADLQFHSEAKDISSITADLLSNFEANKLSNITVDQTKKNHNRSDLKTFNRNQSKSYLAVDLPKRMKLNHNEIRSFGFMLS